MMPLATIPAPHFSLIATLESGQVFHWEKIGNGYEGLIHTMPVRVEQHGETLLVTPGAEDAARRYFALDHDLSAIEASFPGDDVLREAADFCRGLRIIRQPHWECLATFITSAQKQVPHIRQISHALRTRFGASTTLNGRRLALYPEPAALADAGPEALRECALGYRAKNLWGAARMIAEGEVNLKAICELDDDAARTELMRLPGVGEKVANCVLLFAYERLRAFPVDVWIDRVLRAQYFKRKRKVTPHRIQDFATQHFGPYGGYAQQYLFHHARSTSSKKHRE